MTEILTAQQRLHEFISSQLNEQQRKAVLHPDGPLLVIAGAGSGKTRIITARIAYLLLERNVEASSIIALTFTNKAAREMRERIEHLIGNKQTIPFIGTFHAYCLRTLQQNRHLLKTPFSSILDADDQRSLLDGLLKKHGLNKRMTARQLQHQISLHKNQLALPEYSYGTRYMDLIVEQLFVAYEHEKKINQCLDFDDLLLQTLRLFHDSSSFKEQFHRTVKHILVDEYQDTNVVQSGLLKQMALVDNKLVVQSLCAVGDEDQSIYSWRGATVSNIINFNKDFAGTEMVKIEQNYRSVQPILEVANTIIAHNRQRSHKKLWSSQTGTDCVRAIACSSEYQEADAIQGCAQRLRTKHPEQTTAILYRAHFQSRAIEEALVKHALPYIIIGGIQFYERKEIKDVIAYLRLMVNPFDRTSFVRAINCPTRGLGEKFVELFRQRWALEPLATFTDIAHFLLEGGTITGVKAHALKIFVTLFENFTPTSSPKNALEHVIKQTGYFSYLQKSNEPEESKERIENVQELIRAVHHMQELGTKTISAFLDEVALMQEKNTSVEQKNPIVLMTLHAAKGLEFDNVLLVGLEENILPSGRSVDDPNALEEERRLLYVGITRARKRLLLSHCRYRYTYGSTSMQTVSRFVEEAPKKLVPHYNFIHMHQQDIEQFFNEWFQVQTRTQPARVMTFAQPPKKPTQKIQTTVAATSTLRKNQPVHHTKFGTGIVQEVEKRGNDAAIVTVKFKSATKKISSRFLKPV